MPLGLLCLIALAEPSMDEALLRDGRRVAGRLAFADGRERFLPQKGEPISADELGSVRLAPGDPAPLHAALPLRFLMPHGQHLTAALEAVEEKTIRLRTEALGIMAMPRIALAGMRQPPGWVVVASPDNLAEGRVALSFRDGKGVGPFEATFGKTLVRCEVGEKNYSVSVEGVKGESIPMARAEGMRRLVLQFSSRSLRVVVDEHVVWHAEKGPDAALGRLRLAGETSELSLHRACDEPRRPKGEAEQDEAWLMDGDQLFGRFLDADARHIIMDSGGGKRKLAWTKVRGVFLHGAKSPVPKGAIRVELDNGFDSSPDVLLGEVRSLDAGRLVMKHEILGEVAIPRRQVLRLAWPGNGQR